MQITLEGRDRPVPVEAGDTILASLLRAGVPFPFSCQAGNCGTCKCELVSGDVLELEYSEHALSAQERARGIILACRAQVWDDTRRAARGNGNPEQAPAQHLRAPAA